MSKLKIKTGNISMEVVGNNDLIQREREAFLEYVEDHKGIQIGVASIPVNTRRLASTVATAKNSTEETEDKPEDSIDCIKTIKHRHKTNWQELAEKIKNGVIQLEVGTAVFCELTDGTLTEFVVTDVNDQYVRFETRNFIGGKVVWNKQNTNKGGYPDSDIRSYVDSTIWNLLPKDLQAVISDVNREWKDKDGNCSTYTTKLFLPAASEVFGEGHRYGDNELYTQLDYYKNTRNTVRVDDNGYARVYWLASVSNNDSTGVCIVNSNGYADSWVTPSLYRMPICFQISKIS